MAIKIYKSSDDWGLMAKDADLSLVFTGNLSPFRIAGDFLQKLIFKPKKLWLCEDTIDVFALFNKQAASAWNKAVWKAVNQGPVQPDLIKLFLGLTEERTVKDIFKRLGADLSDARDLLNNYLTLLPGSDNEPQLKKIPFVAYAEAEKLCAKNISPLILLLAIMRVLPTEHILQAIFDNLNLTPDKLEVLIVWQEKLNYNFSKNPWAQNLLYNLERIVWLEEHQKISFRMQAIEQAVSLTFDGKNALKLLVQAAGLSKKNHQSVVSSV